MDHPEAVSHLAVLARCDATFATEWWHWFFMGNPDAQVERIINADPDTWYQGDGERAQMGELAWADLPARHPRSGHRHRHVRELPRRTRHRP
jgi:haloacetate dehalogenase